mmetsp:Transcript_32872/g.36418  ORF Transcript_32872/g.36418 Transcript_32872/m.36418 type:complete len:85 (-) Transcript_32872:109-363(-)
MNKIEKKVRFYHDLVTEIYEIPMLDYVRARELYYTRQERKNFKQIRKIEELVRVLSFSNDTEEDFSRTEKTSGTNKKINSWWVK